jgi:hypothetical protein
VQSSPTSTTSFSKAEPTPQQKKSKVAKHRIIAMLIQDAGRQQQQIDLGACKPRRLSNTNVTEIRPGLFLGDINVALDRTFLREKNISHVINCTTEIPNIFAKSNTNTLKSMNYPIHTIYREGEEEIQYLRLNLVDDENEMIACHFQETYEFMNRVLRGEEVEQVEADSSAVKTNDTATTSTTTSTTTSSGSTSRRSCTRGNILVHCAQGVSRSATIVAGYLMRKESMSCQEALSFIKCLRPVSGPNDGFRAQLKQLEKELYGSSK